MSFCNKCGNQLAADARFCGKCGTATSQPNKISHTETSAQSNQRQQVFEGAVHKCPSCGEVLGSFDAICPSCGFEIREKEKSKTIIEFQQALKNFYSISSSINKKSLGIGILKFLLIIIFLLLAVFFILGGSSTLSARDKSFSIASIIIGSSFILPIILLLTYSKYTPEEKKRDDFILTFPIPNTKKDIMEMAILANSYISSVSLFSFLFSKSGKEKARLNNVWRKKFHQIFEKANVAFENDKNSLNQIKNLHSKIKIENKSIKYIKLGVLLSILILILTPMFFVIKNKIAFMVIPETKTISNSLINITGDIADYYRVVDDVNLIFDKEKFTVTMIIELEAFEDIQPEIDKQIKAFLKKEQWKSTECDIELYEYLSSIGIDGYNNQRSFNLSKNHKENLLDLLKMKKGEKKKFTIVLTENKKSASSIMKKKLFLLDFQLVYSIKNNSIQKNNDKTIYIE
ncbi:zinc ribbon domain-containing protein [Treponema sp. OMZ 787]|uniref:zinc ribbon domain-containing protein n=1 Tax=Treponema sp. OMZ 787 TaxID=2563669 RepID=UPI0020A4BD79|nr:zinc ribbon domain-containing protein [Treponema sp. OMZ 787]UTC63459.1 zinc ribbon domain-containing protein [Treponema sp. OMZ 787]